MELTTHARKKSNFIRTFQSVSTKGFLWLEALTLLFSKEKGLLFKNLQLNILPICPFENYLSDELSFN